MNRWASKLYPSSFPVVTPKGNTYPQTMLSYSYEVELQDAARPASSRGVQIADLPTSGSVVIRGEGFGHGVGLSQWGARIMADQGATYGEILSHYYGGLEPVAASNVVPDIVRVGLVAGRPSVELEIDGPVEIEVNGIRAGFISEGVWLFHSDGADVLRLSRAVGYDGLLERRWPR